MAAWANKSRQGRDDTRSPPVRRQRTDRQTGVVGALEVGDEPIHPYVTSLDTLRPVLFLVFHSS